MAFDRSQKEHFEEVITGEDFSQAEFSEIKFYDCLFTQCSLIESVFHKCRLVNCKFIQCDLSLMKVPNSSFQGVILEDSRVIGINWADAAWQTRELNSPLKFLNCILNHSTFIGLHLPEISIKKCTAKNVDFREADLTRADLTGTDFSESIFYHTKLVEADFRRSKNYHINATVNKLDDAKFLLPEAMELLYALDILLDDPDQELSN